jgi:hypothetical protein
MPLANQSGEEMAEEGDDGVDKAVSFSPIVGDGTAPAESMPMPTMNDTMASVLAVVFTAFATAM